MMRTGRMSFEDIVRMYQQPLYWYIRKVVLVHEDAEDILQETFLRACRQFWRLRDPSSLKAWLYRIATNETMRHLKKNGMPAAEAETLERMEACEAPSPQKAEQIVSDAILKMSPLQRQVFCLKYYEDLSYDQISQITGSNKNTLMVSYHEAKKLVESQINR